VGSHQLHVLLDEYGLAVVFVFVALQALGAPVPGTTALVAAALYAGTTHGLPIVGIIVTGAVAALIGTCVGFALGRWRGEELLLLVGRWLRQPPARVQRLRAEFSVHATAWVFVGRFITGVRNVSGLLAGASGFPFARFAPLAAAAAVAWATLNALEYYWFGHALAGANTWVQVVLIMAGLAWLFVTFRLLRRRARRQLQVSAPPPDQKPGQAWS
jgi:membrane protein DedA with SNARE-associated domain